eukprot:15346435-Ditylum_brightwellii.AAC.1
MAVQDSMGPDRSIRSNLLEASLVSSVQADLGMLVGNNNDFMEHNGSSVGAAPNYKLTVVSPLPCTHRTSIF